MKTKSNLAIRFSELSYKKQEDLLNVPLYLAIRVKQNVITV